jgi:hypothetical protein
MAWLHVVACLVAPLVVGFMCGGCGRAVRDDAQAPRYVVTASPIDVRVGSGLCVAVDPSDPKGVWWWHPGKDCSGAGRKNHEGALPRGHVPPRACACGVLLPAQAGGPEERSHEARRAGLGHRLRGRRPGHRNRDHGSVQAVARRAQCRVGRTGTRPGRFAWWRRRRLELRRCRSGCPST